MCSSSIGLLLLVLPLSPPPLTTLSTQQASTFPRICVLSFPFAPALSLPWFHWALVVGAPLLMAFACRRGRRARLAAGQPRRIQLPSPVHQDAGTERLLKEPCCCLLCPKYRTTAVPSQYKVCFVECTRMVGYLWNTCEPRRKERRLLVPFYVGPCPPPHPHPATYLEAVMSSS